VGQDARAPRVRDSVPVARRLHEHARVPPTITAAYLGELTRRPPLSPERERELLDRAARGDAAARAALIEAFLPAIAATARLYRSARVERVELLQEGVVGLLRALQRYDPERGVPFWSYASWWVRQAMQQLVSELTRPVVLSDRALRQLARVREAHREWARREGREPTLAELAKALEIPCGQLAVLVAGDQPARALEEPVDGEDGHIGTFGDLLADPLAEDAYERALDETQIERLRGLLSGLSDRERAVLGGRYGIGGPERTLREIAAELGLSAERVRQIEQRALGKLRAGVLAAS
jgi:RNA polymerase sigma factor (sigma-70 family)